MFDDYANASDPGSWIMSNWIDIMSSTYVLEFSCPNGFWQHCVFYVSTNRVFFHFSMDLMLTKLFLRSPLKDWGRLRRPPFSSSRPLFSSSWHETVASEPERIGVFLTRSCVHVTDISCGVVYEATLASLVLFRSYCYVAPDGLHDTSQNEFVLINFTCTSMSFVDLNFAGHQEIKPYRTFM